MMNRTSWYLVFTLGMILSGLAIMPVSATVLPSYNYVYFQVANDAGAKYNAYSNNTYYAGFFGPGRGQNAHHITTTPTLPFGQVTVTSNPSGIFYITDTGGSGYADDGILAIAVNGTIPDDFRLHIRSSGYNWTPKPGLEEKPLQSDVSYVTGAVDETFTKADFIYGPQIWRPCGEEVPYPLYDGQDMTNAANTFQLMFIDLKLGQLGQNSGMTGLTDNGFVKVEYTVENLHSYLAFDSYAYDYHAKQGYNVIAWTNRLMGGSGYSGLSVVGSPGTPILLLPGQQNQPLDPDNDGVYEDMNGNGDVDFGDVVIYFKQMDWIYDHEPVSNFDFNHNGDIDFDDVVRLFKEV
jgi:PKD repeat protein